MSLVLPTKSAKVRSRLNELREKVKEVLGQKNDH